MNKQNEEPISTGDNSTVLIVNPSSSSGSTGKNWNDFYLKVKGFFGENPEIAFTKKSGDGTTLAREYLKKGFKNIVAIGGDGTINEVANGFFLFKREDDVYNKEKSAVVGMGGISNNDANTDNNNALATNSTMAEPPVLMQVNPDAVFGIISSGTRNVLAKSLDLPTGNFECCKHFSTSKIQKKIDVISATVTNFSNDGGKNTYSTLAPTRIFLNAAEIGVAAEIIDRSKKIRDKVHSRIVSTVSSIVATMPTYESDLCEISIDDGRESILTKMTMVVIANGKYLGGGVKAAPQANVSDGLLDIVILKNSGSFKMLEEFISMKNGNYTSDDKDIIYMNAKKVSIKPKEEEEKKRRDIIVTIDGEPIGILPATFQVHQNALTIKM
ncbi:MAG TPA: diacylglycerol kinase family protein [Nitrososphaeraceae archaeon]|nr:diacylglycerol kinase family protein [Nitrososphaeraceae archaeon]